MRGVFTRRVAAKEVLDHDEARSHQSHPEFLYGIASKHASLFSTTDQTPDGKLTRPVNHRR